MNMRTTVFQKYAQHVVYEELCCFGIKSIHTYTNAIFNFHEKPLPVSILIYALFSTVGLLFLTDAN